MAESRLRRLLKNSTALRTAVVFGLAGVGYALGNLLLARALPRAQFGIFTLFLALVQMGWSPLASWPSQPPSSARHYME